MDVPGPARHGLCVDKRRLVRWFDAEMSTDNREFAMQCLNSASAAGCSMAAYILLFKAPSKAGRQRAERLALTFEMTHFRLALRGDQAKIAKSLTYLASSSRCTLWMCRIIELAMQSGEDKGYPPRLAQAIEAAVRATLAHEQDGYLMVCVAATILRNRGRRIPRRLLRVAFTTLKALYDRGYVRASANLAYCYAFGLGVEVDKDRAREIVEWRRERKMKNEVDQIVMREIAPPGALARARSLLRGCIASKTGSYDG